VTSASLPSKLGIDDMTCFSAFPTGVVGAIDGNPKTLLSRLSGLMM
jgi:hypothetical protein